MRSIHTKMALFVSFYRRQVRRSYSMSDQVLTGVHTSTCEAGGGLQLCWAAAERVEEVYPIMNGALTHRGPLQRLHVCVERQQEVS